MVAAQGAVREQYVSVRLCNTYTLAYDCQTMAANFTAPSTGKLTSLTLSIGIVCLLLLHTLREFAQTPCPTLPLLYVLNTNTYVAHACQVTVVGSFVFTMLASFLRSSYRSASEPQFKFESCDMLWHHKKVIYLLKCCRLLCKIELSATLYSD